MDLTIADARDLAHRVMRRLGHDDAEAAIVADHLIDCELRGIGYGGLARAVSIAERLGRTGDRRRLIATLHETPVSARLDGGDRIGYLVGHRATQIAIQKAEAAGIAVVGASDTWYTGMLSVYAEMAAARGLVTMIASNASPWVAPHGGTEGRLGTNPICFGFPSEADPVIWDVGTSAIIHAEVTLAGRLGHELPPGVAYDAAGEPTRDPAAALSGAFATWGGPRGSGLGMVVQILGMMAGSPPLPPDLEGFGFLIVAMRPDLLGPDDVFRRNVAAYAESIRQTRPVAGGGPVRMPFDRSRAERARRLAEGRIEVAETIVATLRRIADGAPGR